MKTLEAIFAHRSIRKFRSDPISDKVLEKILGAGVRASTSGNLQPYAIVVSKSQEDRRTLWELHEKQDMILEAPLLLTFCSDWNRISRWLELRDAPSHYENILPFMVGAVDAIVAAQTVALAAEDAGLGLCYMGTTLAKAGEIARFLECPQGVMPITSLVMGWPNEDPPSRHRLSLDAVIHQGRYRSLSEEEILEIYRVKEDVGWARYMESPELAQQVKAAGVTNLAQVYSVVKYTKDYIESGSKAFLEALEQQGFGPSVSQKIPSSKIPAQ